MHVPLDDIQISLCTHAVFEESARHYLDSQGYRTWMSRLNKTLAGCMSEFRHTSSVCQLGTTVEETHSFWKDAFIFNQTVLTYSYFSMKTCCGYSWVITRYLFGYPSCLELCIEDSYGSLLAIFLWRKKQKTILWLCLIQSTDRVLLSIQIALVK